MHCYVMWKKYIYDYERQKEKKKRNVRIIT